MTIKSKVETGLGYIGINKWNHSDWGYKEVEMPDDSCYDDVETEESDDENICGDDRV